MPTSQLSPYRCLQASALGLLGMTFHPARDGTFAPSQKGRPALSVACECMCPCTGARLKTLIVCRLLLSFKVYENKNWCTESESKQALFLYSQSHLHIFVLSAQFKEFSSAVTYSLLYCLSSQAPRKTHTSQVSTASCLNLGLWALHHHVRMYTVCGTVTKVLLRSIFSAKQGPYYSCK